jgi:hypothetical protein
MARRYIAAIVGVAVVFASSTEAIDARTVQETSVSIRLAEAGVARGNGVVSLAVFVACGGGTALEALLTLSQDDQTTFGQGSLGVLVCDGVERQYTVRMRALNGTFHRGPAHASAFALICGELACASGGASQTVTLRGRPA